MENKDNERQPRKGEIWVVGESFGPREIVGYVDNVIESDFENSVFIQLRNKDNIHRNGMPIRPATPKEEKEFLGDPERGPGKCCWVKTGSDIVAWNQWYVETKKDVEDVKRTEWRPIQFPPPELL